MNDDEPGLIDADQVADLVALLPDPTAREALIQLCIPLADRLALRFRHSGEPLDDLEQVARFGLIKAVDNADTTKAASFLGYATSTIRGEVRHHLRDTSQLVKRPRRIHDHEWAVRAAIDALTQRLGRSPTMSEIAAEAQLRNDEAIEVYSAISVRSTGDLGSTTVKATTTDNEEFVFIVEWESIAPALAGLSPEERRVLYLRFYQELTQTQVARELGVSQVQVSRMLRKALGEVRRTVA